MQPASSLSTGKGRMKVATLPNPTLSSSKLAASFAKYWLLSLQCSSFLYPPCGIWLLLFLLSHCWEGLTMKPSSWKDAPSCSFTESQFMFQPSLLSCLKKSNIKVAPFSLFQKIRKYEGHTAFCVGIYHAWETFMVAILPMQPDYLLLQNGPCSAYSYILLQVFILKELDGASNIHFQASLCTRLSLVHTVSELKCCCY